MAPYEGDFIWQDTDESGEEHRYHAHRIRRVRAEMGPAMPALNSW
jgi:hypothetical protein